MFFRLFETKMFDIRILPVQSSLGEISAITGRIIGYRHWFIGSKEAKEKIEEEVKHLLKELTQSTEKKEPKL
jgi:hypothetical protein